MNLPSYCCRLYIFLIISNNHCIWSLVDRCLVCNQMHLLICHISMYLLLKLSTLSCIKLHLVSYILIKWNEKTQFYIFFSGEDFFVCFVLVRLVLGCIFIYVRDKAENLNALDWCARYIICYVYCLGQWCQLILP